MRALARGVVVSVRVESVNDPPCLSQQVVAVEGLLLVPFLVISVVELAPPFHRDWLGWVTRKQEIKFALPLAVLSSPMKI